MREGDVQLPAPRRTVIIFRPTAAYHHAMKSMRQLTAIIERENDVYVALCPELDIASQGETVEAAPTNPIEALELFFESADPREVARRLHSEVSRVPPPTFLPKPTTAVQAPVDLPT
jgi:predicted RNase H-like HicB family nuclease